MMWDITKQTKPRANGGQKENTCNTFTGARTGKITLRIP